MPQPTETIEFIPFPGQDRIFLSKARFIFASAGQRGGKTKAGCYFSNIQMNTPGTNGVIAANTIDQLNASVLDKFWQEFPQLKKFYNGKYKQMNLPNGSKVYMRSLDNPDMLRGLNLHWIWADEIDGQNMNTWKILEGRVSNTLGRILGTSSIYRRSFVHEMYKLHKNDPDYEFITWKSKDNPSFPAAEYDRLQRTWDPIDFAREFGGEFSFATGQVYPIQEDHILDKIPDNVKVLEYIYGLDYGINDPNVITVNAFCDDGNWYIIDEYYEPNLSIQQVNYWLQHFIDKYKQRPYATCQDPAGGIARNSLISACRPVDAVKQILERTKLIRNLIYQGKIFVLKKCVNTCREFEYHMFDMKNPELPEDKNNHCFVGDTLIQLPYGRRKIKDMNVGDLVLTSQGYRNVEKVWDNGMQPVSEYSLHTDMGVVKLTCTDDHKIWSNNQWIKISQLQSGMTIDLSNPSMGKNMSSIQEKDTFQEASDGCTQLSGSPAMEKCRKGTTSTTKTATHGITKLKICNSLKDLCTEANTLKKDLEITQNLSGNFKKKVLNWLGHGIRVKKAGNGIVRMEKIVGKIEKLLPIYVKSAEKTIKHIFPPSPNTVTQTVLLKRLERKEKGKKRVYNLTVKYDHEYFANGVLVSNCLDSFGYALHTTWDQIQGKAKKQEDKPLDPFWQRKKDLYKTLQSSDNDNIEFKREADSWSEY